jgi:histidinol-phosphate aminotransferase
MENSRRDWLKKTGLTIMGIGLMPLTEIALPQVNHEKSHTEDKAILLRSNENPYGPSPLARTAMAESVAKSNRYNWRLATQIRETIAKKNSLSQDNVLLGAGSTEVLDIVSRYAALGKGSFVMAATTFDYWTNPAETLGLEKIAIPLTSDKKHDLKAMLRAIRTDTKLIYVCNPNNPTGTVCDSPELKAFIAEASKKALILVDEAYIEFTNEPSMASVVKENKNVVVARTFSKVYGMAGARIGYAIAHTETIEQMSTLQATNSGISIVSGAGALAALKDEEFVKQTRSLNEEAKRYTIAELEKLGLKCIPSYTNFVYFSLANYKKNYFETLEKNNILGTRIYDDNGKWTRITIGTLQEMQQFIKVLQ